METDYIGAASHSISAAMQTLGLYYQGVVLSNLTELITTMGALFFTVGLFMALCSIAIFGNYKRAFYFAIAPALFFLVLDPQMRVNVSGTEVRFGKSYAENIGPEKQKEFLNLYDEKLINKQDWEVSWVFVQFDNLVTAVVHRLIDLLLDTENRKHILVAAREKMLARILDMQSYNMYFLQLLSLGMVGQCSEQSILSKDTSANKTLETYKQTAKTIPVNLTPGIIKYLLEKFETGVLNLTDVSDLTAAEDQGSVSVSCGRVWEFVLAAAKVETEIFVETLKESLDDKYKDAQLEADVWKKAVDDAIGRLSNDNPSEGVKRLAAILIKNSTRKSMHGAMTEQLFTENPIGRQIINIAGTIRASTDNVAETAKLAYWQAAVTYIQGFFLMVLCIIFPFFALFLLIPSKATSFFVWLYIWIWVKSWDLGFAVLTVVREIFWPYFSKDAEKKLKLATEGQNEITSVFEFMTVDDITATPFFFTSIMALLTMAVPAFTAHLCLGAGNLMKFFSLSTDSTTSAVGDSISKAENRIWASAAEKQIAYERTEKAREAGLETINDIRANKLFQTGDASPAQQVANAALLRATSSFNTSQRANYLQSVLVATDRRMAPKLYNDLSKELFQLFGWQHKDKNFGDDYFNANPYGSDLFRLNDWSIAVIRQYLNIDAE